MRTYVFDYRCDIEIGQVTVHDQDIVFGDVDGVLIIPRSIAETVIEKALEKASTEKTMRKAIERNDVTTALVGHATIRISAKAATAQTIALILRWAVSVIMGSRAGCGLVG